MKIITLFLFTLTLVSCGGQRRNSSSQHSQTEFSKRSAKTILKSESNQSVVISLDEDRSEIIFESSPTSTKGYRQDADGKITPDLCVNDFENMRSITYKMLGHNDAIFTVAGEDLKFYRAFDTPSSKSIIGKWMMHEREQLVSKDYELTIESPSLLKLKINCSQYEIIEY